MLQHFVKHVQHQLPDTIKRVKCILDNVDCKDSDVQAGLYSIRMDEAPKGLRNDFEAMVTFLLPNDPVPKKRKEKRSVAEISVMTADENKTS